VQTTLLHLRETQQVQRGAPPVECLWSAANRSPGVA
jgi:hypothetical protein